MSAAHPDGEHRKGSSCESGTSPRHQETAGNRTHPQGARGRLVILLDASAIAEYLDSDSVLHTGVAAALTTDRDWMVPEHCRLEAASALRGLMLGGVLGRDDFSNADEEPRNCRADDLLDNPITVPDHPVGSKRHGHRRRVHRLGELRHPSSAYRRAQPRSNGEPFERRM